MSEDILEIYQGFSGEEIDEQNFKNSFEALVKVLEQKPVSEINQEVDEEIVLDGNSILWGFIKLKIMNPEFDEENELLLEEYFY